MAELPQHFVFQKEYAEESYIVIDHKSGERLMEFSGELGNWSLRDLGGSLPVFVNGRSVEGRVKLKAGDLVQANGWSLAIPPLRSSGGNGCGIRITLKNVTFSISKRIGDGAALISEANVDVHAGEFVGILGPSGAGKSTLLHLMNSDYAPTDGSVLFDGTSPETQVSLTTGRLAYLPQEPVLYDSLTPRQALWYAAKLRGISNAGNEGVSPDMVLTEVGMGHRGDTSIFKLSGGEKKRIALAVELLGEPLALFLDEATSGLDPALEKEMMVLFRQLANSGKTIVCITHYPDNVLACDRLIIVSAGRIVFEGTPQAVLAHFHVEQISEIYPLLTNSDSRSFPLVTMPELHMTAVDSAQTRSPQHKAPIVTVVPDVGTQLKFLMLRYVHLLLIDYKGLFLLLIQAPVIALLIGGTFGNIAVDYSEQHAADWKQVAFLLIMAILWCAGTNAIREIVKERNIYLHERRYGLIPTAYLISKFIPLGIIGAIQSCLLLLVLGRITHLAGNAAIDAIVLSLLASAATSIGLCISAAAKTSERAMSLLPVILIGQAVFSGGLARLTGIAKLFACAIVPAFWGLNGLKATLGSNLVEATYVSSPGMYQPPILGRSTPLWADTAALCLQCIFLLALTLFFLKRVKASR